MRITFVNEQPLCLLEEFGHCLEIPKDSGICRSLQSNQTKLKIWKLQTRFY